MHILAYNTNTPRHLPVWVFILGGIILLWLLSRLMGMNMTFGDLLGSLGLLGMGVGVVILALRWKPSVTNTTTNTYPTVNHQITSVVHTGSGSSLGRDIAIAAGVALIFGIFATILRRLH